MKSLFNVLTSAAINTSLALRRNPFRFLNSDLLSSPFLDHNECEFFCRKWSGPIWDVGASIGKFTTLMAKSNPRQPVYAFEPNLNSLYFLGHKMRRYKNAVIVPNALTVKSETIDGTCDPDFCAPATGPKVATIGISEAIIQFGIPDFIKMDIEGGEYDIFDSADLSKLYGTTILVSWHPKIRNRPVPCVEGWENTTLAPNLTVLTPPFEQSLAG